MHDLESQAQSFDALVDACVVEPFAATLPAVLAHYTSVENTLSILRSQRMWATAHYSSVDAMELRTADGIVTEIARLKLKSASPRCQEILRYFLNRYHDRRASSVFATFLACFSESLDDAGQWERYGRGGSGVCLQFAVINGEGYPKEAEESPIMGRTMFRVRYDESELRNIVFGSFQRILDSYDAFPGEVPDAIFRRIRMWAGAGLDRVAAYANTAAKRASFRSEQEWRLVAIARRPVSVLQTSSGKDYVPLRLRIPDRHICFHKIQVGARAEPSTEARVLVALQQAGYPSDFAPMPVVDRSTECASP